MVGDKDKFTCYTCDCSIITEETDKGRPPYILPCMKEGCDGVMRTHFNKKIDVMGKTPEYELRFPTDEEYDMMGVDFQQKADNGVLIPFKAEKTGQPPDAVANKMRKTNE